MISNENIKETKNFNTLQRKSMPIDQPDKNRGEIGHLLHATESIET